MTFLHAPTKPLSPDSRAPFFPIAASVLSPIPVRAKFDQIACGKLRPGARIDLSNHELTTYVVHEAPNASTVPR